MSEVKIFNRVKGCEIIIDTKHARVIFHPKIYDDKPNFEIKLGGGFNFFHHAETCKDCGEFKKDINSDSLDWYLTYNKITYRLEMNLDHNKFSIKNSYYEYGSTLHLFVNDIPLGIEELTKLKEKLVLEENYEDACIIRDLINRENEN